MKSNRKVMSVIYALVVLVLCSVNMTYAWTNLNQVALNVMVDRSFSGDSGNDKDDPADDPAVPPKDDADDPSDSDDKPQEPGNSDTDPSNPDGSNQPSKSDPSDAGGTSQTPQTPSGTNQSGKSDLTTGDTFEFVFYLLLMLVSFVAAVAAGVCLIALAFCGAEKRRRGRRIR